MERLGVHIRPGTPNDTEQCHRLLWRAITDLATRQGTPLEGTADDWWPSFEPLSGFLSRSYAEWWVAEGSDSRTLIGYARSIERGGLFELTEFFVLPDQQARGVGRALLQRAFPAGRGEVRSIIATTDVRALARYYGAGVAAQFPFLTLARPPAADARAASNLETVRIGDCDATVLSQLLAIERAVLDYDRGEAELRWLLQSREGYLYRRDGRDIGYAFIGSEGAGPIAALDADDLPGQLVHVEARAHELGASRLALEVPGVNSVAIRHLLGRGFQLDPWINVLMSSRPFGQFDRYIAFSPPVFL
jgi:GNAT superfamily N-acetyltransferase